jgi:hypothetical protein
VVTERAARSGASTALGGRDGGQRQHDAGGVAEHVSGVREQREAAGDPGDDRFHRQDDEGHGQHERQASAVADARALPMLVYHALEASRDSESTASWFICTMRYHVPEPHPRGMTTTSSASSTVSVAEPGRAPLSRGIQITVGLCLVAAGLTNGLAQYVGDLLMPTHDDFTDQIRWGAEHPTLHVAEQTALVVSMLVLPIGLLGLAQLTRWGAPRLTAVATVLVVWGMWGFHNVVALGYAAGTVGPDAIGVDAAAELNEAYLGHAGTTVIALLPHLLGSFLGLLLLAVAGWRSRTLPRSPLVLLVAFLIWDFGLPAAPPFEPHVLLAVALGWLGVHVIRLPQRRWHGRTA